MIKLDQRSLEFFGFFIKAVFKLDIETRCRLKQWKYDPETKTKHDHKSLVNCGWPASTLWVIYRVDNGKVY